MVHGTGGSLDIDRRRYDLTTVFTWCSVFGELELWAALGSGAQHQQETRVGSGPPPQLPIDAMDALLRLPILNLTGAIASNSVEARIALTTYPQCRAVACLVSLIALGLRLELKGAIFEMLAAFRQPSSSTASGAVVGVGSQGVQGVDICRNVRVQMESFKVMNAHLSERLASHCQMV